MFGFRSLKRLAARSGEVSVPAPIQSMILVCKEDIYRHQRDAEPILLLKKGSEVEADDLPKFIRNGARASQFYVKFVSQAADELDTGFLPDGPDFQRVSSGVSNPILSARASVRAIRNRKHVLILEPDQKSLKRLIDCLFACGFNLNQIHPVRVPDHLSWAMEKYKPQLLIVDYRLGGKGNGLGMLESLEAISGGLEQVMLTVPSEASLNPLEANVIRKLCTTKNIQVIHKPVNRLALNSLLDEADWST